MIANNADSGMIYILKDELYDNLYKIGRSSDLPIVYLFKTNQCSEIEKFLNKNLEKFKFKNKGEIYYILLDKEKISDIETHYNPVY